MFLHVYFPHLVSGLIKIHYWGSEDNAVEHFEHLENACREGQSFLVTVNEITFTCDLISFSFSQSTSFNPATAAPFLTWLRCGNILYLPLWLLG